MYTQRQIYTYHWRVLCCQYVITGPPNGPVLFCSLASVVVVCRGL